MLSQEIHDTSSFWYKATHNKYYVIQVMLSQMIYDNSSFGYKATHNKWLICANISFMQLMSIHISLYINI